MSNRSGFTLIEAVVTVFIITVALWGTVTGFLKMYSLVKNIENIAVVDKYIAGEMERIRSTDYDDISEVGEDIPGVIVEGETITMSTKILNESDESVSIQVKDEGEPPESITIKDTKEIKISADWISHASRKSITRTITFYVYEKGINWRP